MDATMVEDIHIMRACLQCLLLTASIWFVVWLLSGD